MPLNIGKKGRRWVITNNPRIKYRKFTILKSKPLKNKRQAKDEAFEQLKAMAEKWPDDQFLQDKVRYYIPYENTSAKTDDDYLYGALKEKYCL